VAPDPEAAALVQTYEERLSKELDIVIGTTETGLDSRRAAVRDHEAAIGNLITDAMREAVGAQVAMINGGGIRANREYPAGTKLTRRDIQSELPFGNKTVKLELKGSDILAALENGFSQAGEGAGSRRSRASRCASTLLARPAAAWSRCGSPASRSIPSRPTRSPPTTTWPAAATTIPR
jgi:2',3'-cyclic-nucleotide 2'-phosphodiesterase (5'-nucleotidase family)